MYYLKALLASDGKASSCKGLPLLAMTCEIRSREHPGLNPSMVYAGARKRGLDASDVRTLTGLELSDLMFA